MTYDELYQLFGGNPTPPAISKDEVDVLETTEFESKRCKTEDDVRNDQLICPICLQDYVKGERIMVLPSCNHTFHSKCVVR